MRTQKLPGLSKASGTLTFSLFFLHYDLIYGVNYCLDYGTSEILVSTDALPARVNYRLVYDVFETAAIAAGTLIAGELLPGLRYIRNADLVMSLSIKGELLLGLPYLRNALQYILRAPIGKLLIELRYLRNLSRFARTAGVGELLPGLPYLRNLSF